MGVKIINRNYTEPYTAGSTDWLLGNVTDWQNLLMQVEVAVEYRATQQEPIQVDYINNAFVLNGGKNWGEYGFDAGMIVTFKYKLSKDTNNDGSFEEITAFQFQFTITNIYSNVMEVNQPINAQEFENLPTDFGTRKISDVILFVDKSPEGIKMKYTHLSNANFDDQNLASLIDGTTTEMGFANLPSLALGQWGEMEFFGLQSGMSIRRARIRQINAPEGQSSGIYVNYKNVGNPNITVSGRKAHTFELNRIYSQSTNYKSVTSNAEIAGTYPTYGATDVGKLFLNQAGSSYSQQLSIIANFRITFVQDYATNDFVALSIVRYTGSGFAFAERIELKRWNNADSLINTVLNYGELYTLNVISGSSYSLVLEYFHPPGVVPAGIKFTVENMEMQGGFPNATFSGGYKKYYEVHLQYMISSLFDSIDNFELMQLPEYLQGDGSLTDNSEMRFFPEWNNPNIVIQNDLSQTQRLGNTGWFNENFNQLPNDFLIDSVEYFDVNGNQSDSLDYTATTKVKIVISGVSNLNTDTECGFGFSWVPTDEQDYKNKLTPFYRNVFVQSGSLDEGFKLNQTYNDTYFGAGIAGGSMDTNSIRFTSVNGKIVMEANFVPNSAFSILFDQKNANDRNYILWVSVADGSLGRNFSDRVTLLADVNVMQKYIPPAGAYPYIDNAFIEHPYDENNLGVAVYDGLVQDDILCRAPFRIRRGGGMTFQRMKLGVEAFNLGLNESFELERYDVDLSQYPTDANGIQQFDFDQSRGFKLNVGNSKNFFKVIREPLLDTIDFVGYIAYFGTKIRWEDWIINQNAPGIFFNADEPNNGLNNDWVSYIRSQGWIINFFTEIDATLDTEAVRYKNQWKMKFVDYDENDRVVKMHKYYRDSDNFLINVGSDPETGKPLGVVLFNEPTRIEISFDIQDDGEWDLLTTYAVMTLEIDKGAGRFEQRQISSEFEPESDNPLRPVQGETKLKLTVDVTGKLLTAIALVDPTLVQTGSRYRITCREGCKSETGTFNPGLYEFRYENTYE